VIFSCDMTDSLWAANFLLSLVDCRPVFCGEIIGACTCEAITEPCHLAHAEPRTVATGGVSGVSPRRSRSQLAADLLQCTEACE